MAPARDGAEEDSPEWGRAVPRKPAPKSRTRAGALWNFFNAACECDDCDLPLTDGATDGTTDGGIPTSTDGAARYGATADGADATQGVESTAASGGAAPTGDAAAAAAPIELSDMCADCDDASDGEGASAISTAGGEGAITAGSGPAALGLRDEGGKGGKAVELQSWGGRARLSPPPPSPPPSPAAAAPEAAAGGGLNARAVYFHLLGDALLRGGSVGRAAWQGLASPMPLAGGCSCAGVGGGGGRRGGQAGAGRRGGGRW